MQINHTKAKNILTSSKLPDADFVINPYIGCQFACRYCYATFMKRFTNHVTDKWGSFVDIKINTTELLKKNIVQVIKRKPNATILFGSVTDAYQPIEAKYKLTRKCLQVLQKSSFKGKISILTKSPLVMRDINIFQKLSNIEVGLTITGIKAHPFWELYAPNNSLRLKALKQLNKFHIPTYAFIGPLLPDIALQPNKLNELFKLIKQTGTNKIWVEFLHLNATIRKQILENCNRVQITTIQNQLSRYIKTKTYITKLIRKYAMKHGLQIIDIIQH